jgi:outer membrane protein OmpA-like peptidoglycan-associated protein
MELSQARTRSTLSYVLGLPSVDGDRAWLTHYLTANGLSSSRPILDANRHEDAERSRRVEFRVRTDAESRIATIMQVSR